MLKSVPSARRRRTTFLAVAGLTAAIGAVAPTGVLAATLTTTSFAAFLPSGFVALTPSHTGRKLDTAGIGYTMKCSDNTSFTDWDGFQSVPISSSGAFTTTFVSGPRPSVSIPGATTDYAAKLAGKLNKKHTRIKGTARFVGTIKKADGTTVTCDSGLMSFTAKD